MQQQILWTAGEPAFYVELANLAPSNLLDLLSHDEEERFDAWLKSQSDVATFFLDSIDELKLSLGSFDQALKRGRSRPAGNCAVGSKVRSFLNFSKILMLQDNIRIRTDPSKNNNMTSPT